jgi:hypothetical protein
MANIATTEGKYMSNKFMTFARTLPAAALLAALAACGGGGGSGSTGEVLDGSSPPSTNTPGTPPPGDGYQAPVNPPTDFSSAKPLASTGNASLDWINAQRDRCGAGALASNSALSAAAAGHSSYLLANNLGPSHTQVSTRAGFTGTRVGERSTAAGYAWSLAVEGVSTYAGSELAGAKTLVAMPYHRIALMDHRLTDVGMALASASSGTNAGLGLPVIVGATPASERGQALKAAAQGVCAYPADGDTNVALISQNEYPNPTPEIGSWGQPSFPGYTISIQVPANRTLTVNSFALYEPSGRAVPVKIIDRTDTIRLKSSGISHWAFAVPLEPLKASSTYSVAFSGQTEDGAVSRNWSFSTRSADMSIESVERTPGGAKISVKSPADYVFFGSPTKTASCPADYAFRASAAGSELVITHTSSAPAAGCAIKFNAVDPVSRKEQELTAAIS